ncbi:autotransporter-associated beta strand repeat-containing protein [Horticoccus luteus]|uniref:Autotransporter-associated beta strand repeat-containing protein n=1 Tax=Horticoccus luteus TaxID=2862869 RepID=A0A8F9TU99_9BACT|nr:autotransporter-associated beta strand repeat-containing protein [Horticoccus luteus]QYM77898.1 autotransporter-associated beta strand repeat-containing protein [Horticoccus luteus]
MRLEHAIFQTLRGIAFRLGWLAICVGWAVGAKAQVTLTESFTGTSAPGWLFGGSPSSTSPYLTANTVDTAGNGWLRMTENTTNQSTFALFDSAIFSVNAQIQITLDYTTWNGSGADGITFFLVDGAIDASTFQPGAYGGSMGYAQKDAAAAPPSGVAGMTGGYLGFAFDDYGNYSSNSEGRNGGLGTGLFPNRIAVRGPESSGYEFIAASSPLDTLFSGGQMDFPTATIRPDQNGADYRSFRLTLDANNLLTVEMKFGATGSYITAFTSDLSSYDRPDTFKIGFTGATGGSTEIHEVRNVAVTMTPWQPGSFEWGNGAGTTDAGTAANWVGNTVPGINADVLLGNKPTTNQTVTLNAANTKINSLTFDAGVNYTLNGTGSLLLGDTALAGLPSINVNDYNGAQAQHHIDVPITLAEELRINNYSFSTLCLNGPVTTGGNDIKLNGNGAINFNADINGAGNLIKNGTGTTTINSDNSNGATPWTGNLTINQGMVVVTTNGALGTTAGTTTVNSGGALAFRAGAAGNVTYTAAEAVTINGLGVPRGGEGYSGAIYNDGGNNSFAGNITMAGNSGIGSREGVLTLSGKISDGADTYNLTKMGAGVVELTNSGNDWNGVTRIEGGALRISNSADALAGGFSTNGYSGGNLQLAGGVLESGVTTTFTRQLGMGSDQVQWVGDGGFSASGSANRTFTLTNAAGTANGALTWAAGSFVPDGHALLLSSDAANRMVTLTNAINFGGANREVRVANGSAAVDATLSGVLSNGGLIKTGAGTLNISGANTYTGPTEIRDGALRGTINANSNIALNGGVLELTGNMTRSLGAGGANLQWKGDGGFSASGANRTVSLNNNSNVVKWGSTTNFVGDGKRLILGSNSANRTLTLTNAIDLNGANRTVLMQRGTGTAADGLLSGVVSNGSLTVEGNGRLDMTAANTLAGSVTVKGAELRLQSGGTMTSVSSLTVRDGGTFTLDNGSTNNTNRVKDTATVTLLGGTLSLLGRTGNNDTTETVGVLTLAGGANTVVSQYGDNKGSAQLTFGSATVPATDSLVRTAGATVNFAATGGTMGGTGDNPRIKFGNSPALVSNVLGYATVNGTAFAGYGANGVVAVTGTNTAQGSWTSTVNATPTADQTLSANRTVGSLSLGSGIDINAGGYALTVNSGGLLTTGSTVSLISNGTIRAGTATGVSDLVTHVYGTGGLNISAVIADNGGAKGLTKTGDGVLTLSGTSANTFTGPTYVNDGILALNKTPGVNAIVGNVIVGDGRGTDVLRLDASEQIANTANVTLRGAAYGGETKLQFNGAGGAGVTETFGTLTIDGVAVIDFAGGNVCDANFLFLDDLLMATTDSMLYIRNWIDFSDFLLVRNSANLDDVLSHIKFEGYGDVSYWQDYDATYSRVTPVPEPSTYGLIFVGASLAFFGFRRWRQGKTRTADAA